MTAPGQPLLVLSPEDEDSVGVCDADGVRLLLPADLLADDVPPGDPLSDSAVEQGAESAPLA